MNDCRFFGRLTRDPELRYTPTGVAVADFTLAVDDTYVKNGEKVKNTDFLDFVIWNGRAEAMSKYAKKGQRLLVSGRAKQETWESPEGRRSKIKFRVSDFEFVDYGDKSQTHPSPAKSSDASVIDENEDDDSIPF